jgi:hypothetical protein
LTAEISNSSVTFSLTSTPPASSAAFQLTPQSLRLMTREPSKPIRSFPNGSVTAPVNSSGKVTDFVVPRIVRSPVTSNSDPSPRSIEVVLNEIVG